MTQATSAAIIFRIMKENTEFVCGMMEDQLRKKDRELEIVVQSMQTRIDSYKKTIHRLTQSKLTTASKYIKPKKKSK
jgi:flavodoxin